MDKNWSRISDGVEDPLPLGLVDIAECEALIQENKSEKKHQDSANILQYIAGLKKRETDFYMSLNLKEDLKIDLFKIKLSPGEEVRSDIKPPKRREENDLLILQHPLQGNLVITKEDLNQFENQTLQK